MDACVVVVLVVLVVVVVVVVVALSDISSCYFTGKSRDFHGAPIGVSSMTDR